MRLAGEGLSGRIDEEREVEARIKSGIDDSLIFAARAHQKARQPEIGAPIEGGGCLVFQRETHGLELKGTAANADRPGARLSSKTVASWRMAAP